MLDFIRLLKFRYQTVSKNVSSEDAQDPIYRQQINSLTLTEAFLQKGALNEQFPEHPVQIAVMGPTQAGKSSVVNLLLDDAVARVSPLAGFTIQPQGFGLKLTDGSPQWLSEYFNTYQRFELDALPRDRHGCYAFTLTVPKAGHPLPACVVWDTPDFDSIGAEGYRDAVLRCAALADVVMLVVSKDKYADQTVWDMMTLLEPLGQPTLICLNKVTEENRAIIARSLQQKWQSARSDKLAALAALPYCDQGDFACAVMQPAAAGLFEALKAAVAHAHRPDHPRHSWELMKAHWSFWSAPVTAEHEAIADWEALLEQAVKEALALYRRDYLDHPQHYETFQRALAELLALLEIPGLATALKHTRTIITWPVRQLINLSKREDQHGPAENSTQELVVLKQVQEHLFIQLMDQTMSNSEQSTALAPWWKQMMRLLREEKPALSEAFMVAAQHYHRAFAPEIEAGAQQLYKKLKEQPATLNSLRATRLTTDAAAVALALKTGGIGVHDFVLTPAVLSLTSLLAESALGSHMNKVAANLKKRQYKRVEEDLFLSVLRKRLRRLPQALSDSEQFNIPVATVKAAEDKLEELRYGLRLL